MDFCIFPSCFHDLWIFDIDVSGIAYDYEILVEMFIICGGCDVFDVFGYCLFMDVVMM